MKELIHFLEESKQEQFALLERLVLQSSHSADKAGTDAVGDILCETLAHCSLDISKQHHDSCGDSLIIRSSACSPEKPYILLLGHMDTVFPRESEFNFYREDDTRSYGPGVCDMKGGLVSASFVLKALDSVGFLETLPIVFLCNGDEEIGSPYSTPLIKEIARDCLCGLVFECGGLNGEIVTGRKGKSAYTLEVSGKAGHSAFSEQNGKSSAILELAHKIIQLEELNGTRKGIVVNVGTIDGGIASNVIAESAKAEIDTRFILAEDGQFCRDQIEKIVSDSIVSGTIAQFRSTKSRFPMKQTESNTILSQIYKQQAELVGFHTGTELRSGVSDANTLAECNKPVIDGLGPIGNHDHSDDEYIEKTTLTQRCKAAALSVVAIWDRYIQQKLTF